MTKKEDYSFSESGGKICTDIENFVGWRVDRRVSKLGLSFLNKIGHLVDVREWMLGNLRKVKSLE